MYREHLCGVKCDSITQYERDLTVSHKGSFKSSALIDRGFSVVRIESFSSIPGQTGYFSCLSIVVALMFGTALTLFRTKSALNTFPRDAKLYCIPTIKEQQSCYRSDSASYFVR